MQRGLFGEWTLLAVIIALSFAAAAAGSWVLRLDQTLYDLAISAWRRPPAPEVMLVKIDDPSLAAIGRWPWSRAILANVIDRIGAAKPAAMVLDVILAEEDSENPLADEALAAALRRAPSVLPVFKAVDRSSGIREILPIPIFLDAASALGHIDGELDSDGVARRVFLYEGIGAPTRPHFAVAALELARPGFQTNAGERRVARAAEAQSVVRDRSFLIPFNGPAGSFEQVSFAQVLRGEISGAQFAGRIVLIGTTAAGLGDQYPTPVTAEGIPMPGIEVIGNTIDALLNGYDLREAKPFHQMLIVPIALIVLLSTFLWLSPRATLVVTIGFIVVALVGSVLLFRFGHYWFSPVLLVLGALVAYPLWTWRRLEAANRYLVLEMRHTAEAFGWNAGSRLASSENSATRPDPTVAASSPAGWLQDRFEWQLGESGRAAAALRHSRQILAQSFVGLPIGVVVCDRREHQLFSNPPADQLLGLRAGPTRSLAVTSPVAERLAVLAATPVADWRVPLEATFRGAQTATREIQVDERTFLVTIAPYALVDQIVMGAIIAIVEVTAMRQLEREREELMQFVSHDLRSPQNSIIAAAQLARDDSTAIAPERLPAMVEGYAQQTLALIDTLLALFRAERLSDSDLVEVDLGSVVQDAIDDAWPQASARAQTISVQLPEVAALVRGRAEILARAALNLISNAMKFSPNGSAIDVTVRAVGDRWILSVRDRGPGIPAEAVGKLFQRFYRVSRDDGTDPGGTGLGLAFVKTVATKLGGEVSVETVAGAGATFSLALPRADDS